MILLSFIFSLLVQSIAGLIHWPSTGVSQCKPTTMAYDSYESGMKVAGLLLPGQQNVTTVIDLPPQCSTPNANGTFNFVLNVPAGTEVAIQVIDNSGGVTVTPFLTVQTTEIKNCLAPAYSGYGNYTSSGVVPSSTIIASGQAYNPDNYTNLSTGAIVGIAIGAFAGFVLLCLLLYYLLRRNKEKHSPINIPSANVEPVLYSSSTNNASPSPLQSNSHSSTSPFYPTSPSTNYNRFSSGQPQPQQPSSPTFSSDGGISNEVGRAGEMGTGGLEAPDRFAFRGSTGSSNGNENENVGGGLGRFPAESMTPLPR